MFKADPELPLELISYTNQATQHRFIYRYERGQESAVLGHISSSVGKIEGLDWYSAAMLANQIKYSLVKELKNQLKGQEPDQG